LKEKAKVTYKCLKVVYVLLLLRNEEEGGGIQTARTHACDLYLT
jgi:hypothetical protein